MSERLVFVHSQTQVVSKESADLAIKAAQQTGVSFRLLGLPGEKYECPGGGEATLEPGQVLIGVGQNNTPQEVQIFAQRHQILKNVVKEIKESVGTK